MKFLNVDTLEAAREKLLDCADVWLVTNEVIKSDEALGRVLAEDIVAVDNVPHFRRSTVDGYAVISSDTAAAGESIPVFLTVKERIEMGQAALFSISSGECAEIATGGMLPGGADAVVMVEYSELFGDDEVAIYSSVSYSENVVQIGEDVRTGELLVPRGKRILPQDIGSFAAAGIISIPVYSAPKIVIISTGDELIFPENAPNLGQIRDVNTHALSALASKYGFEVVNSAVVPDDRSVIEQTVHYAMEISDIVIVSGGSSQGEKDMTRSIFEHLSEPGVFTHGLAIKPGKPTILGFDSASKTVLAGLPGHPVAAMVVFELLLCWLLRELTGCTMPPAIAAKISCNIAGAPGRQSFWLAKLIWTVDGYVAEPIFGKSGLISTLTKADGYFMVDRDVEGLIAGETVLVHLF